MPTKTAVKEKVTGTAVEEAEEGTTPTPAPAASGKKRSAEEEPAKSSESDASADPADSSSDDEKKKDKAKKPPSLADIQRSLYKGTDLELWVSPEYEVQPEGAKESRKVQFVFPRMTTVTPNRQFLRKIYNLEPLFQYFEWMNLAQIPPFIQDLTDGLDDDQFNDLFNGWFTDSEIEDPKA